jgi:type VI secretion system protein ImpG
MVEKYYEDELRYLYNSGSEFAKAHPDRARFLNIDAVGDRDPYVERLFEGFAFLAARIREKLDDSFPELTEGFINLMWPHFQQEIPSIAIVEFKPRRGHLQETRVLERGVELLTNPVGSNNTICKFITTQKVDLNPVALETIDKKVDTKGRGTLTFNFKLDPGIKMHTLKCPVLKLYIHGEMPVAFALHELLTRHVTSAEVSYDRGRTVVQIDPKTAISVAGFSSDESLLPGDSRAFWGYALLLEYFVCPEKYLFVNLNCFDDIPVLAPPASEFSVTLSFDCDFPKNKPFEVDNFKLFCSPVVNLFKKDAEPVLNDGRLTEYPIVADYNNKTIATQSIVSVTGMDRVTGERHVYEPFHTFKTITKKKFRTFTSHYRDGFAGKRECYVTLGGSILEKGELSEENLSIEIWSTNGLVPREELREGSISKPGQGFPDFVMFTNITRPSLPIRPPLEKDYLWTFLSHLGASYSSLSTADALKTFLRLYEWTHSEGRARRIDAITNVAIKPAEMMLRGSPVRGIEYTVEIEEAEFNDSGDLHLFGEVLKEFITQYVSINSFVEFAFILRPSGKQMRWNSLEGKRWPI